MEAVLTEVVNREQDRWPSYGGERFYCDECQTVFRFNQLIAATEPFVFCGPNPEGALRRDCMAIWRYKYNRDLDFVIMRFHGNT